MSWYGGRCDNKTIVSLEVIVASCTKDVNSRLAKRPLVFIGGLANRGLTSLVKEATEIWTAADPAFRYVGMLYMIFKQHILGQLPAGLYFNNHINVSQQQKCWHMMCCNPATVS